MGFDLYWADGDTSDSLSFHATISTWSGLLDEMDRQGMLKRVAEPEHVLPWESRLDTGPGGIPAYIRRH